MEQKEKDLTRLILGLPKDDKSKEPYFDPYRKSTLQMALETARFLYAITTDADNWTVFGEFLKLRIRLRNNHLPNETSFTMTSVLLYLNCLEQVGNIFSKDNEYGICNAIKLFADKNASIKQLFGQDFDIECTMIQHLRHALAHNLGLVNIDPRSKSPKEKYCLTYEKDASAKVVTLPSEPWTGDYADKRTETSVKINVPTLIKLSETIIAEAQKQSDKVFENKDDAWFSEIQTRFTIRC
ncbi:MAG: hypothetical protein J6T96_00625 [Bacteroidales bacterium]|nr:hypothetical protein [Bacteroidales bacterium]